VIRFLAVCGVIPCIVAGCDFGHVCTTEARPGIRAIVRDSTTGAGLATGTIAVARQAAFTDTLMGADSVMWGVYERAGVYRLEVSRPGYRDWVRDGLRVTRGECHVETIRVSVLLQSTP
jgi:hypothetical protein